MYVLLQKHLRTLKLLNKLGKTESLKTNRHSGFDSQKCIKQIPAHQKNYSGHIHPILFSNVLISLCLTINIVPHDGKKGKI